MILRNYFMREILRNWLTISVVLVVIILMNQFVFLLSYISAGLVTITAALELMLIQVPEVAVYLLPLGMYLATFLTIGRWCADSELIVCYACGISIGQFYRYTAFVATTSAIVIGVLVFGLVPHAHRERLQLSASAQAALTVSKVIPRNFQAIGDNGSIIYAGARRGSDILKNVFVALYIDKGSGPPGNWSIIRADRARQSINGGISYVGFSDGSRAVGTPSFAAYQQDFYKNYAVALVPQKPSRSTRVDLLATPKLFKVIHTSLAAMAEWQWRWAMPLATIIMSLLAVPLAQVNPRRGKFGKFLPAIIIYIVYANLLFISRSWIKSGKLNPLIGMWSVHLLFALIALVLIGRHLGWFKRGAR